MPLRLLDQKTLDCRLFWADKVVLLPGYDRKSLPVKSLCFSAGRMAYGHTADILQDLLNENPDTGLMAGIETFAARYCADLAASDYLLTQLIYENEKGKVVPKIQGAIAKVLFVDADTKGLTWQKFMEYARDPAIQFGTINAPEGAYGVVYKGGEYATPTSSAVKQDMETGSVISDAGKWTAFARERFHAGLKFALVSCTNFSGNGHVTGATLRTVARAWEDKGFAPKGLVGYLSDPSRFSFPNTMIDRIAVPPDEQTRKVMEKLGIASNIVVTERTRYWVVEDLFPNGRPEFEKAEGVIMEESYEEVKKYEDMKLRILNMAHSVIAGLGVLLGYRGQYGIYRAMQDKDIRKIIDCIICIVSGTIEHPGKMDPAHFAKDTIERLNNANIPDDPMRIAFNGSTKMQPRLMDTYFAGVRRSIPRTELDLVLLGVAGFLRYTVGTDDEGKSYPLEADPIKDVLVACGQKAVIGDPASSVAFRDLISRADVMGRDLYSEGDAGRRMQEIIGKMLAGPSSVRKTLQEYLRNR